MSVDMHVYLSRSCLPTAKEWANAVQSTGHKVILPCDFDVEKHTGFLPCKYQGLDTGFEYYTGALAPEDIEDMELEPDELNNMLGIDYSVSLIIKGNSDDGYKTAHIVAACLAKLSGGTIYDPQGGLFSTGESALEDADAIFSEMSRLKATYTSPPGHSAKSSSWVNRAKQNVLKLFA